jgi:hypothetical protein
MTLAQLWCGWFSGGHTWLLVPDARAGERTGRIFHRCGHCGAERPGWTIDLQQTKKLERKRMTFAQQEAIEHMKRQQGRRKWSC